MSLKSIAKTLTAPLPVSWRTALRARYRGWRNAHRLRQAERHDTSVYARFSGLRHSVRQGVLQAQILKSYHRIEKGLALAAPRPGFGADAIALLIDDLQSYRSRYGDDHVVRRGVQTLAEYQAFNRHAGIALASVDAFLDACGAAGADQAGRMRHPDAPRYAIKRDQTLKDAEQVFTRHELPIPLVREHRLFLRHDAFLPITHEHFGLADVLHVDSRLFGGA